MCETFSMFGWKPLIPYFSVGLLAATATPTFSRPADQSDDSVKVKVAQEEKIDQAQINKEIADAMKEANRDIAEAMKEVNSELSNMKFDDISLDGLQDKSGVRTIPPIHVHVPKTNVHVPGIHIHIPAQRVKKDGKVVDIPAIKIDIPDINVNIPDINVNIPEIHVNVPPVHVHPDKQE
jgi:hypothetical protein